MNTCCSIRLCSLYQVFIPLSTFYELPERREVLTLQIYTAMRENVLELYGFLTMKEKE